MAIIKEMFGQVLSMTSFQQRIGANEITNPVTRGLLTAILELGAWIGVLCSGYLADKLGRRWNMIFASGVFTIGIVVQACARNSDPAYTYGGRFVAGLGVGGYSINVPLYVIAMKLPANPRMLNSALQRSGAPSYLSTNSVSRLVRACLIGLHMEPISSIWRMEFKAMLLGWCLPPSSLCLLCY